MGSSSRLPRCPTRVPQPWTGALSASSHRQGRPSAPAPPTAVTAGPPPIRQRPCRPAGSLPAYFPGDPRDGGPAAAKVGWHRGRLSLPPSHPPHAALPPQPPTSRYERDRVAFVSAVADAARHEGNAGALAAAGAVGQLIPLLRDPCDTVAHTAAFALGHLAGHSRAVAASLARQGIVGTLVSGRCLHGRGIIWLQRERAVRCPLASPRRTCPRAASPAARAHA